VDPGRSEALLSAWIVKSGPDVRLKNILNEAPGRRWPGAQPRAHAFHPESRSASR